MKIITADPAVKIPNFGEQSIHTKFVLCHLKSREPSFGTYNEYLAMAMSRGDPAQGTKFYWLGQYIHHPSYRFDVWNESGRSLIELLIRSYAYYAEEPGPMETTFYICDNFEELNNILSGIYKNAGRRYS